MQPISTVLAGYQASILPQVQEYWLSNEPWQPPPDALKVGDRVQFIDQAINSQTWEIKRINYSCGECELQRPGDWCMANVSSLVRSPQSTPEQQRRKAKPKKSRRPACGWIEERKANPKRANPTTCYYFCWYEVDPTTGERQKRKTYVPQAQMSRVWSMVKVEKRPWWETATFISKAAGYHHIYTPKL